MYLTLSFTQRVNHAEFRSSSRLSGAFWTQLTPGAPLIRAGASLRLRSNCWYDLPEPHTPLEWHAEQRPFDLTVPGTAALTGEKRTLTRTGGDLQEQRDSIQWTLGQDEALSECLRRAAELIARPSNPAQREFELSLNFPAARQAAVTALLTAPEALSRVSGGAPLRTLTQQRWARVHSHPGTWADLMYATLTYLRELQGAGQWTSDHLLIWGLQTGRVQRHGWSVRTKRGLLRFHDRQAAQATPALTGLMPAEFVATPRLSDHPEQLDLGGVITALAQARLAA